MCGFVSGTDGTGQHLFLHVLVKGRPPKASCDEGDGSTHTRMGRELGCMHPLDETGSDRSWNIGPVWRSISWVRFRSQGKIDEISDFPGNGSNRASGREDRLGCFRLVRRVKARERVGLDVLGTGSVRDN